MRFFRKFSKQKKTPIPDVPANEVAEEEDESSEVEEKPAKPVKHKAYVICFIVLKRILTPGQILATVQNSHTILNCLSAIVLKPDSKFSFAKFIVLKTC